MRTLIAVLAVMCAGCAGMMDRPAGPGVVKITPLGSHDGEFCPVDRALLLEDPDGTRILYDAGRTVRGANDPRLGKIDAVLLTHVHDDHLGDRHQPAANAGACGKPDFSVQVTPNSNTANIAAGKKARILVGSEMHSFLASRVRMAGGDPNMAGKTGTAEVTGAASHSWFVGYAPATGATTRTLAFAVIVENGGYGASVAVPVAGEVVAAARSLGLLK